MTLIVNVSEYPDESILNNDGIMQWRGALSSNEGKARCLNCGIELEQSNTQCPRCKSARVSHDVEVVDGIDLSVSTRFKRKMKGVGTLVEMITNRWKPSGDARLGSGVKENMIIDKEQDEYRHVTRNAKTGEITHEEHEKLSEHKRKGG